MKPYIDRELTDHVKTYREEVFLLRTAGYPKSEVLARIDFDGPDYLREDIVDVLWRDLV